jgi:hypothetical protein
MIYFRFKTAESSTGFIYALGFFLALLTNSISIHQLLFRSERLGLKVNKLNFKREYKTFLDILKL